MAAVDQNVIEAARIVEGQDNDLAARLEQKFEEIARKLFPELDWERTPLQFRVSDGEHVNASIFSFEKPPVVVIDRGLLEFIENEDELAFVIGHEMGHDQIRSKLGYTIGDSVTKTEEASADVISVLRCVKAGYNYHAGIDFFTRLDQKIKAESKETVLGKAQAVFDPHPMTGNRLVAMELALANENLFKSGTVRDVPATPLSDPLSDTAAFSQLHHQSFLDGFLPSDYETLPPGDKIEWLRKALETTVAEGRFISDTYTKPLTRSGHILDELKKIKATPEDDKARTEAERIIGIVHRLDPYNGEYKFDQFYSKAAGTLVSGEQRSLPALGPFAGFGRAVDGFLNAPLDRREEASAALMSQLSAISPYLAPEDETRMQMNTFDSFGGFGSRRAMRQKSYVIRQTEAFSQLDRNSLKSLYADANSSPAYAEAIWRLGGAFDPAYWDVIGEEQLSRLRSVSPALGYMRSSNITERHQEFSRIQKDIDEKLIEGSRKAAQENTTLFLADPEAFLFAHAQELFPKGNPNGGLSSGSGLGFLAGDFSKLMGAFGMKGVSTPPAASQPKNKQTELSEQIRDEVTDALQSGDNERVAQAMAAITTLYESNRTKTVRQWLWDNGQQDHYQRPRDFIKRSKKAAAKAAEKSGLDLFKSFNTNTDRFDPYALSFCSIVA